jgi:parallel beta-helix repeat protein
LENAEVGLVCIVVAVEVPVLATGAQWNSRTRRAGLESVHIVANDIAIVIVVARNNRRAACHINESARQGIRTGIAGVPYAVLVSIVLGLIGDIRAVVANITGSGIVGVKHAIVTGCTATGNTLEGILLTSHSIVRNNNCNFNGAGAGSGAGIHTTSFFNAIEDNLCTKSAS